MCCTYNNCRIKNIPVEFERSSIFEKGCNNPLYRIKKIISMIKLNKTYIDEPNAKFIMLSIDSSSLGSLNVLSRKSSLTFAL